MFDFHKNISVVHLITPQAVGTSGIAGGKLSAATALDRQGYEAVEIIVASGASATVADTISMILYESNTTTSGDFTSVADADLLGSETALTLTAAKSKSLGYKGNKRYLRLRVYGTGTATAIISATALLARPHKAPIVT